MKLDQKEAPENMTMTQGGEISTLLNGCVCYHHDMLGLTPCMRKTGKVVSFVGRAIGNFDCPNVAPVVPPRDYHPAVGKEVLNGLCERQRVNTVG